MGLYLVAAELGKGLYLNYLLVTLAELVGGKSSFFLRGGDPDFLFVKKYITWVDILYRMN